MTFLTKKRSSLFVFVALVVAVAIGNERTAAREGFSAREQPQDGVRTRQIFSSKSGSSKSGSSKSGSSESGSSKSSSSESGHHQTRRLREGTVVNDANGFFREDGDGATFVADSGLEFGALPNLNLERVLRLLKSSEEPNSIRWSVSGTVTEFSGRNFLLIRRAIYKSATPPPAPGRISQPSQ